MQFGYFSMSWWQYVLVALAMTHVTIACVTLYLHRSQAHRALEFHPFVSHFFRFWLWMSTGMDTKAWVAIHRKHHAKCETEDDPHSPQIFGLKTVLWQGAELYRKEAKVNETLTRYGQGTPNDWLERNVYHPHSGRGILLMLIVNLLLFGIPGVTIWAVQMAWIPFFAAGVVNGVGHFYGYRNFDCPDASTNISPVGLLIGGEELHNNHHSYPTSAKLSIRWWEFDIGWFYIVVLRTVGLAKVKKLPPKVASSTLAHAIEAQTVRDLIANRLHVMKQFSRQVAKPALHDARGRLAAHREGVKAAFERLKTRFTHNQGQLESIDTDTQALLAADPQLQVVHSLFERLQAIWNQTTASQKELIDAIQQWCADAEASGSKNLQRFAAFVRGYRLKAA